MQQILSNTRIAAKPTLRKLSEMAIVGVLGRVPRRLRRPVANRYANAAWRQLRGLPPIDLKANAQVIDWVVREFKKLIGDKPDVAELVGAASPADDVGSPAGRPPARNPEVSVRHVAED